MALFTRNSTTQSPSLKRKWFVVVALALFVIFIVVTIVSRIQQNAHEKGLASYTSSILSISYPESFSQSFSEDGSELSFTAEIGDTEEAVTIRPILEGSKPPTIDDYEKLLVTRADGEQISGIMLGRERVDDANVLTTSQTQGAVTIESWYYFYENDLWNVTVSYGDNTEFSTLRKSVLKSFRYNYINKAQD